MNDAFKQKLKLVDALCSAKSSQPSHNQKYGAGARKMKAVMSSNDILSYARISKPDGNDLSAEVLPFRSWPPACLGSVEDTDVKRQGGPHRNLLKILKIHLRQN